MQKPSINIVLVRNPALDDEDDGAVADAEAEADVEADDSAATHDDGGSAHTVSA